MPRLSASLRAGVLALALTCVPSVALADGVLAAGTAGGDVAAVEEQVVLEGLDECDSPVGADAASGSTADVQGRLGLAPLDADGVTGGDDAVAGAVDALDDTKGSVVSEGGNVEGLVEDDAVDDLVDDAVDDLVDDAVDDLVDDEGDVVADAEEDAEGDVVDDAEEDVEGDLVDDAEGDEEDDEDDLPQESTLGEWVVDEKTGKKHWYVDGEMAVSQEIYDAETGAWYWVDANGDLAVDVDVFFPEYNWWVRYDENGERVTGEDYRISDVDDKWHWWYFDAKTGAMLKEFVFLEELDKLCYYDPIYGWMLYGEQCLPDEDGNRAWYYLDDHTGAVTYGWKHIQTSKDDKWVYYDDNKGTMLYGQQYLTDGSASTERHWYYFDDVTGATQYGFKWIESQQKTVYYAPGWGWMLYGWQNIDGQMNYFDEHTGAQRIASNAGYAAWQRVQNMSSSSSYLIAIDNSNCRVVVFTGSQGNWEPYADWICAVGRLPYPGGDQTYGITARGVFTITRKGYIMGQCPYEFYWSEFFLGNDPTGEGQRFHSILYWDQNHSSVYEDGRGSASTHGCVRLTLEQAKWIYDVVPIGTTVYSYA